MKEWFGEIHDGIMMCNDIGEIVSMKFQGICSIYRSVQLHERVVMPNHIHGILVLSGKDGINLSRIIKGFKMSCTKEIRTMSKGFLRHTSFHDHIIRTEESYNKISSYILNNPLNREKDTFNQYITLGRPE